MIASGPEVGIPVNYVDVPDYILAYSVPQALSTKSSYKSVIIYNIDGPSVNSLSPSIYWWGYLHEFRCIFQISSFCSEDTIVVVKELMEMVA
jgi:hypothetical protein